MMPTAAAATPVIDTLVDLFAQRRLLPYVGPGALALDAAAVPVPADPGRLVAALTQKSAVPFKLRGNLPGAAQYIENFKHRKTLAALMTAAFAPGVAPNALHRLLATLAPPLVVGAWYDDALASAFGWRRDWGMVQGVSQAERVARGAADPWVAWYDADGAPVAAAAAEHWRTLLYQPLGSLRPAQHYLVSDSDFVEVLTEIDIQTPIPARVQQLRRDRHFLYLGCRFSDQLARSFARQIAKRSSARHWAVLDGPLTRNEARFVAEQGIEVIDQPLAVFVAALQAALAARPAPAPAAGDGVAAAVGD